LTSRLITMRVCSLLVINRWKFCIEILLLEVLFIRFIFRVVSSFGRERAMLKISFKLTLKNSMLL
jgi:hypothetical protein